MLQLSLATCEILSSVMGDVVICVHIRGDRDFTFKVPISEGDSWQSVITDNGAPSHGRWRHFHDPPPP
jgi:hypothetical protein